LRNLSEEEENEPILRSTSSQNQNENADMEKNRREYRDYMLKMYDVDVDEYLNDSQSEPILRASPQYQSDDD
jgi:hypothetical protein